MGYRLDRYFLSRWAWPFAGALLFYGGLSLANEMVFFSKEIFSQGGSFRYLIPLLLTSLPESLGMVLPMAAVLGGLLGTQQLSESSEMVASQGLGVGSSMLLRPWAVLALVLVALAGFNAHVLVPRMATYQKELKTRMLDEARTRFLKPGAPPWFPPASPERSIWMDPQGEIHLMEVGSPSVQHLVAKDFQWSKTEREDGTAFLTLSLEDLRGSLYQKADGSVVHFSQKSHDITIEIPRLGRLLQGGPVRYLPTGQLLALDTAEARSELSRRIALPLASGALLLLGIALGLGHPRFRKGGAIVKSLGVILLYYLLLKFFENQYQAGKLRTLFPLYLLPFIFLAAGLLLLFRKHMPHRSNSRSGTLLRHLLKPLRHRWRILAWRLGRKLQASRPGSRERGASSARGILGTWTRRLWWRNWGATLGTFLTLNLLVNFASLAADLSRNRVPFLVFLQYWVADLPPFLAVTLPLAFLLGGVLALSEATLSREWVALRAGGTSLLQWIRAGGRAWGLVLLLTALLQTLVAPALYGKADALYQRILGRPARVATSKPWMHLGATGILWYLDGATRWGFPLKSPGAAPVLLRWQLHQPRSQALAWGGMALEEGPFSERLFPERALRETATAEEAATADLVLWQRWAPDPERATMFWGRLLNWLAGPCLLFAMLPYAFPTPRGGRGRALGLALGAGLLFLGLQALFTGAAKAGEIPAVWGVLSPLLIMVGVGLSRLYHLKT